VRTVGQLRTVPGQFIHPLEVVHHLQLLPGLLSQRVLANSDPLQRLKEFRRWALELKLEQQLLAAPEFLGAPAKHLQPQQQNPG
jgi:hypothetical protein